MDCIPVLLSRYGVLDAATTVAEQTPLESYADSVVVVRLSDGRALLVKWSRGEELGDTGARLQNQAHLITHCSRRRGGAPPRVAPLLSPASTTNAFIRDEGKGSLVQVFEFVPGPLLHAVLHSPSMTVEIYLRICCSFGVALGRLSRELQSVPPAPTCARVPFEQLDRAAVSSAPTAVPSCAAFRALGQWDLRSVSTLRDTLNLGAMSVELRALVDCAVDETAAVLDPLYARSLSAAVEALASTSALPQDGSALLRMQWIHGDANDMNVLVASQSSSPAEAVSDAVDAAAAAAAAESPSNLVFMDFDDAAFGFTVHDPAIALPYIMMGRAPHPILDPISAAAAFVHGFTQPAPLSLCEIEALPAMIRSRLAASLMMSCHAAAAEGVTAAAAAYIRVHAEPAADLLRRMCPASQLTSTGVDIIQDVELTRRLLTAAGLRPSYGLAGAVTRTSTITAAAAAAAAAAMSYRSFSLPLSPDQTSMSARVVEGLTWLGAHGLLSPVVTLGDESRSSASAAIRSSAGADKSASVGNNCADSCIPQQRAGNRQKTANIECSGQETVGVDCAGRIPAGIVWTTTAKALTSAAAAAAAAAAPENSIDTTGASAGAGTVAPATGAVQAPACDSLPVGLDTQVQRATSIWKTPPFVYDWGWENAALSSVVGTDQGNLRVFTELTTAPLLRPASAVASSNSSGGTSIEYGASSSGNRATGLNNNSSTSGGIVADDSAVCHCSSAAIPLRLGWGQYAEDRSIYQSEHFTGRSAAHRDDGTSAVSNTSSPAVATPTTDVAASATTATASPTSASPAPAVSAPESRTMHLGVDLQATPGTAVRAPLSGRIHSFRRNTAPLDYGPAIVVEHTLELYRTTAVPAAASAPVASASAAAPAAGSVVELTQTTAGHALELSHTTTTASAGAAERCTFYTLYGHLSLDSICTPSGHHRWTVGAPVHTGDVLGWVGSADVNGGWPPHLHFQCNTQIGLGGWAGDYPGVCALSDWPAYAVLCPDPNILLRCPYIKPVGWDPVTSWVGVRVASVVEQS